MTHVMQTWLVVLLEMVMVMVVVEMDVAVHDGVVRRHVNRVNVQQWSVYVYVYGVGQVDVRNRRMWRVHVLDRRRGYDRVRSRRIHPGNMAWSGWTGAGHTRDIGV